jgi:hypothetical protein
VAITRSFQEGLLSRLGLPNTASNRVFLDLWSRAEGSKATHNPLATTMAAPGATDFNKAKVKNYPSEAIGIDATARTLRLPSYAGVLSAMRVSDMRASAKAVVDSPWGTKGDPLMGLIDAAQKEGRSDLIPDAVEGVVEDVVPDLVPDGLNGLIGGVGRLTGKLLDAKWWLRVGQGLVAALLLILALVLVFRKQVINASPIGAVTKGLKNA